MSDESMNHSQYTELTKAINGVKSDISDINQKMDSQSAQISAILLWIRGDKSPDDMPTRGADTKITRLEERVYNTERAVERINRIDELELKVQQNEKKLEKIWTIAAVVTVMASIIGTLAGIFIPPLF